MRAILRPYKAKPETAIEKPKMGQNSYKYINVRLKRIGTVRQEKRTRISYFGYEIRMAQNELSWRQWLWDCRWLGKPRDDFDIDGGWFLRVAGIEFMPAIFYRYKYDIEDNDKCLI